MIETKAAQQEEIDGEKVKSAVIQKIVAAFEGVPVYKEKINAQFAGPCFFVQLEEQTGQKQLANRFCVTYRFCVAYFPAENGENTTSYSEIWHVQNQLSAVLDSIEVGARPVYGSSMESKIQQQQVLFYVRYTMRLIKGEVPHTKMGGLQAAINRQAII